jgi:hypothetical protein
MRKILFLLIISCLFPISKSFATPPTSINLSYDQAKGNLHVEAVHPSFDLTKSYVRLMLVYVNDAQVSSLNYFKQNDYNEFTDDVPLTAQVGDVIKVDLFCTLGGEMAKEMTVEKQGG